MDLPSTLIPLTHVQEERALREEVTKAFHTAIPGQDEEVDDFLVTKDEVTVDDVQAKKYREFLLEQAGGEEGVREILGMGSFPDRIIDAELDGEVQEGGPTKAEDGDDENKKKTRTKDHDEEFLMKSVIFFPRPLFFWS
jgi:protein KRI1